MRAEIFDPRSNSIGFLRLAFAVTVIVSHTWPLGGFGIDPGRPDNNLGFTAVEGFFALSGFLITGSATKLSPGRFMWHRILRIFPGYWVALVVCAFGFGLLFYWHDSHNLAAYFVTQPLPTGYLINNWLLQLGQTNIAGVLQSTPFVLTINGPLYTLVFEFICYLLVLVLAVGRMLNLRVTLILVGGAWLWLQALHLGLAGPFDDRQARLTLCFLVGATIYLAKERILTRGAWLPVVALVLAVVTYFSFGFAQVGVIALSYLCIWAGAAIPFRVVHLIGRKRDFSYGVYIYGWPVMQLCSLYGLPRFGIAAYLAAVLVVTLAFAVGSWYLVESRALSLKNANPPAWFRMGRLTHRPGRGQMRTQDS